LFWLVTKRILKKALSLVRKDIKDNKENIEKNSKEVMDLKLVLAEMKGMIKVINESKVREQSANSPRIITKYHKKAKKIADKVQLVAEIKKLLNKDISTAEMYNIIVLDKKICGKTCFYKHLKKVRELSMRTPRTIEAN